MQRKRANVRGVQRLATNERRGKKRNCANAQLHASTHTSISAAAAPVPAAATTAIAVTYTTAVAAAATTTTIACGT